MAQAVDPPAIPPLDLARLRYDCLLQARTFTKASPASNPVADAVGIRPAPAGLSVEEALKIGDQLVAWCLQP